MIIRGKDLLEAVLSTMQHYDGLVLALDQVAVDPLRKVWGWLAEEKLGLKAELLQRDAILPLVVGRIRIA